MEVISGLILAILAAFIVPATVLAIMLSRGFDLEQSMDKKEKKKKKKKGERGGKGSEPFSQAVERSLIAPRATTACPL